MSRLAVAVILATSVAAATPGIGQTNVPKSASSTNDGPLVLSKQGSFFVNERSVETAFSTVGGTVIAGHLSVRAMYVQYQIPQNRDANAYPMILVHGSNHTAKTYEETPDGRMGWAEYFVRRGVSVYVVEHAGRGRSGFDPSPSNRAKAHDTASLAPTYRRRTNEQAWTNFRIGAKAFTPFENTQFPVAAAEQYFAQMVPNTETSYPDSGQATVEALTKLLDRVGPAVLVVHSQSGRYGIAATIARPTLVKGLVSIEPGNCAIGDADAGSVFSRVPFLTVFGDFQNGNPGWEPLMTNCVSTVNRIKAVHGIAENLYLPDRGIRGNSHMMMMDRNNLHIGDLILAWLRERRAAP